MLAGTLVILVGLLTLGAAWKVLHRARGGLVTHGPYAVTRHPQYGALFLVIVGAPRVTDAADASHGPGPGRRVRPPRLE